VLILGDEAAGMVRGVGVFSDRGSADAVNSDPELPPSTIASVRFWQVPRSGSSCSCCTTTRSNALAERGVSRRRS
jgi:hypothetical protein